jgi:hypothetical protein
MHDHSTKKAEIREAKITQKLSSPTPSLQNEHVWHCRENIAFHTWQSGSNMFLVDMLLPLPTSGCSRVSPDRDTPSLDLLPP